MAVLWKYKDLNILVMLTPKSR